jgi:hypothetical protein
VEAAVDDVAGVLVLDLPEHVRVYVPDRQPFPSAFQASTI